MVGSLRRDAQASGRYPADGMGARDIVIGSATMASDGSLTTGDLPEARARLKAFVIATGLLNAVAIVINIAGLSWFGFEKGCAHAGAGLHSIFLALALVFVGVIGRTRLSWRRLLDLALGYVVLTAFGIAFAEQSQPAGGLSAVAVLLVLFPLFVPTSVPRAFATAVLGVSTLPLAMVLHDTLAGATSTAEEWVVVVFTALVALLAVVPAKIVRRMTKALHAAKRLGPYELVERIGSGGMGEVWRARHRLLRRPAAVKLIRPEKLGDPASTERAIERFEREAQATASLDSPHAVQLYDFGVSPRGELFHVMELLRGIDLESFVERFGPMPPERVVHVLLQVCDALEEAHRAGLVHRDVKPANLFLARKGRRVDWVKVLDFGLVKEREATSAALTADGELAGTPAYLAPEVATGDAPVDGRADLYALGCVAYYLLTGERVFEGETAMKVAIAHVTQAPERPSERLGAPIPAGLEALVMRCLEKDPAERPEGAAALALALEQLELEEAWDAPRARDWWCEALPELSADLDAGAVPTDVASLAAAS
ncbi:MAG: serine/threonine protein kinase [Sandaracinus sp.]|nr:serine/threonine protein kinase [Sandaracinus sp.]